MTRVGFSIRIIILSNLLVSFALTAHAAENNTADKGTLRVIVHDPSGAIVEGARVMVTRAGSAGQTSETNDRGEAFFSHLRRDPYAIHVEALGFGAFQHERLSAK